MTAAGAAVAVSTPAEAARLGTVLGVWAHPDDEAWLSAGLMALAASAGSRVVCVHATDGELGTADPVTWPPERLARVRAREARASLRAVGVREQWSLRFPDGACADVDVDEAVSRITALIARVRPATIVTFGPDGITGHPDHVTVGRWAELAWRASGGSARLLQTMNSEAKAMEFADVYAAIGVGALGGVATRPLEEISVEVRLDDEFADRKLRALLAHRTQMMPVVDRIGVDALPEWWRVEPFAEVVP